jgi:beta-phosphoglucomutase-like phosphatase (HAD superfamily)
VTAPALQGVAHDELRKALAARQDGNRVTYDARKADQIAYALRALHPQQGTATLIQDAIRRLRRLLAHDLPLAVARHIRRAIHHANQALQLREAAVA